jgi:hypothetical protein
VSNNIQECLTRQLLYSFMTVVDSLSRDYVKRPVMLDRFGEVNPTVSEPS